MITVTSTTKATVAALAMAASFGASAVPMTLSSITGGSYTVWDGGATLLPSVNPGLGAVTTALGGNAAAPGGNVELSKFGGPVTLLSGTGNGHTVTLSSLVSGDWTANGNALAIRYIQDAATAAFGIPLTAGELVTALDNFFNLDILVSPGVTKNPWQFVSDPNISYVDIAGNTVSLGLAGLIDASPFLTAISGIPLAPGKQVSEVVKMSFDGSDPIYLYGFVATPSGVSGGPAGQFFTGNYNVTFVPEPADLALFGLGLVGLLLTRRRR